MDGMQQLYFCYSTQTWPILHIVRANRGIGKMLMYLQDIRILPLFFHPLGML